MHRQSTEVRQRQIIDASLEIIAEKGVSGLTTGEVAKRVGFSEAALFRHFPNKLEILKATMISVHEALISEINIIVAAKNGPLTKLEDILRLQLSFIEKNRGMPRILFSDELHLGDTELRETIVKRHRNYMEIIKSVMREAISAGIFRADLDVDMAARAFFGMIQTAVFNCSLNGFKTGLGEQYEPIARFLRGCFIARSYCG